MNRFLRILLFNIYSYGFRNLFNLSISLSLPLNSNLQGISSPPSGKSEECLLPPLTVHEIQPPLLKNSDRVLETFLSKCPIMTPLFKAATAYLSNALVGSLSHTSSSPTAATHKADNLSHFHLGYTVSSEYKY